MELIIINRKGEKFTVLYDECDHETVSKHKWFVSTTGYVVRTVRVNGKNARIILHRVILGVTDPKIKVDHKNHNTIDNRRCNIRACSHQQNLMNRKKTEGTYSKYLGVSAKWTKTKKGKVNGPYIVAEIKAKGSRIKLGYFKTEEDAAIAYDKAAEEYFGEFASLNFKNKDHGGVGGQNN